MVDKIEKSDEAYDIVFEKGATPGRGNKSFIFDPYSKNLGNDNATPEELRSQGYSERDIEIIRNMPGAIVAGHEYGHEFLNRKDEIDKNGEHNVSDTEFPLVDDYNRTLDKEKGEVIQDKRSTYRGVPVPNNPSEQGLKRNKEFVESESKS